ncbi:MAG: M67 family metallopeptidase [Gemmatimonadetes bacterium]|nr:M67 family metallopeptidase [Gemmatimonadota bacterium]
MQIAGAALDSIRQHLTALYPLEGCGFLLGAEEAVGESLVRSALAANNRRGLDGAAATRYLMGPDDFRDAEKEAGALGLQIVGTYHSHPDVAATPSQYDLEHAWPWYRYLIVSIVEGSVHEERVWQLRPDRSGFVEHQLHIKE